MAFNFPRLNFSLFERNVVGDTFSDVTEFNSWASGNGSNLGMAQDHPILTPALLFVSKLFSQADFYIENKVTGAKSYDHWLLVLLKNPNYFQTGLDFLETSLFTQIASGKAVVWLRRTTGMTKPSSMYLLNPDLIEFPDSFKTNLSVRNADHLIQNTKILYDRDGSNETIPLKDLLFLYDLPNGLDTNNLFNNKSRLDGLKQTLINTKDSLLAKNIILKTNGKELITGKSSSTGSFPLSNEEKEDAEKLFFGNYGLGHKRKRGILTKADLKWQSLHIALRDLGLDESVKVDGNLIYTALHIPKDILSLEAKKTTYNNFKESMVSYIQNEMQSTLDAFCAVFQQLIEDKNTKLVGNYHHLPIMQFMLLEKYDGLVKKGAALKALREAGLPDDIALQECGYDKTITLKELAKNENTGTNQTGGGTQASGQANNED
jgi:hypothetical protein